MAMKAGFIGVSAHPNPAIPDLSGAEQPCFLDELARDDVLPTHFTLATNRELVGLLPGESLKEALDRLPIERVL